MGSLCQAASDACLPGRLKDCVRLIYCRDLSHSILIHLFTLNSIIHPDQLVFVFLDFLQCISHSSRAHSHSMATMFLHLPPEVRREIYLSYFRSVTVDPTDYHNSPLALLQACRLIYLEAVSLVLPNVKLHCTSNIAVIEAFMKLGPARIPQLRYLKVGHCPMGFNVFPDANDNNNNHNDSDASSVASDGRISGNVRYFHLGAILGLFPGLQLDLLEVYCSVGGGPYTGNQTTDCFGSLLEADGYRRLWMEATTGDGDAWLDVPSTDRWEGTIKANFKPYADWMVLFKLPSYSWEVVNGPDQADLWKKARKAGITLVAASSDSVSDSDDDDAENEDDEGNYTVDIVVDRGDADFVVKKGGEGGQLLRCIAGIEYEDESPEYFKEASDALRRLFETYSWKDIQAMSEFDDGSRDRYNEGDAVYANWY